MRTPGPHRLIGFMLVLLWVASAATPSFAQPGRGGAGMGMGPGMGDGLEPGISSRDLERYAAFLGMSPDQVEASGALLEGYQAEFEKGARDVREMMDAAREEFRETRDFSIWEEVRGTMEAWRARRTELEKTYFKDVRELLTEAQAAQWPRLERMRRRDATMRRGLISGESVDVIRLVDDLKLSPEERAPLGPSLEQYETELDRALQERNEAYETGMGQGMNLWRTGDMAAVEKLFEKARDAAVKVREINRRAARQVEGLLPEARRAAFSTEFRDKSFPRVYGGSYASRAIGLAQAFKDLTEAQGATLTEIKSTFERESSAVNDRLAKAIEESELTQTAADMMSGGGSAAVRAARQARRELDDRTIERLKSVLTEDQKSRLPDRRGRDGGRAAPGGPERPGRGEGPETEA